MVESCWSDFGTGDGDVSAPKAQGCLWWLEPVHVQWSVWGERMAAVVGELLMSLEVTGRRDVRAVHCTAAEASFS